MDWKAFIGPATFIYLISLTVGGVWWASDISSRVASAESQVRIAASASERITRVETLLVAVDKQLDRIDQKLDRERSR